MLTSNLRQSDRLHHQSAGIVTVCRHDQQMAGFLIHDICSDLRRVSRNSGQISIHVTEDIHQSLCARYCAELLVYIYLILKWIYSVEQWWREKA